MAAEDMTIDEALIIAVHANRHPAHVKHAALRVLARAYRVEHATLIARVMNDGLDRIAELEADPPCAERDQETGAPLPCAAEVENERLRARVAELELEVRQYREDMAAVSDAIGARGVATTPGLLSFIAKLGEQNGTEWGVRRINDPAVENPDGAYALLRARSDAQRIVDRDPAHWELVNRRPPGTWQAAT
jgi:hypothetical protein